MTNHPLKQYVQTAKQAGMTNEQILRAITEAGWHAHDLVEIAVDPIHEEAGDDIITVRNVKKSYGEVQALKGVSLNVKRGSVTALLGPNGAGKTTLVRILSTLLRMTEGSVTIAGLNLSAQPQEVRGVIGLTGQYAAVDEILTGRENLEMVAKLYHLSPEKAKARASELLKQFSLEDAADRTLKTYSGGMRRRLDLAASIINHPKILFLDEPTTGLDPRSRFALWNVIRDLVAEGTTVLLTTQYLEEADQLADKIFVIDHGTIIAQGTADELKHQVGGNVLELHVTKHEESNRAAELIQSFGSEPAHIEADQGMITLPVSGGADVLVNVVRALDGANIGLANILLRRPSLDDVFMKLTGHGAE